MTSGLRKFVLVSGSPIRRKILKDAGYSFSVSLPDLHEEPRPSQGQSASEYVLDTARVKAASLAAEQQLLGDVVFVACDQVVEYRGEILTKVNQADQQQAHDEALERLSMMSGQTHHLTGALSLWRGGQEIFHSVTRTGITLHDLDRSEISRYLTAEKPWASVACYYLEGHGIRLVKEIDGSWFAALGFDLLTFEAWLRKN